MTTSASNLVGVSLDTGAIVSDVAVPFWQPPIVGQGQQLAFDSQDGRLIAVGQLSEEGDTVIGYLEPSNGHFAQVASINTTLDTPGPGAAAYVPSIDALVLSYVVNGTTLELVSVDMRSGAISLWPESFPADHLLETLDYDPHTGLLVGLGLRAINETASERTLVSLDPLKQTWGVIGTVPDFLVAAANVAAINPSNRTLYWVGEQSSADGPNNPFYLIALSLEDASVQSASILCSNFDYCPWSLEWTA